jgi:neutral ceramidase
MTLARDRQEWRVLSQFTFPRMSILVRIACVSIAAAFASMRLAGAEEKKPNFRAGADRADITPELGILIVGSFNPTPATEVHDPLYVRTLVLDDGATRIAFVLVDNVGLPRIVCDEAKRVIAEKSKLAGSHVLIAATHTHSGGSARERSDTAAEEIRDGFTSDRPKLAPYQQFIARRVADSVANAIRRLEPAKIGWGSGSDATHVFNRRWHVKSEKNRRNPFGGVDSVRMNPPSTAEDELIKPAGPVDPDISFLSVQSKAGRPIALLANYSLHYVGGVPIGVISGDYFGVFDQRLGEMFGADRSDPPFVGMMSNGTSGDINNINFRQRSPAMAPYEKMQRVGNAVAAEVFRACQSLSYHDWVKLDARHEELALASRRPTPEMVEYAKKIIAKAPGQEAWHPNERTYAQSVLRALTAPAKVSAPLQAFRIGELGIAATPIETFVEVGLELKSRTPFAKTFTISIANAAFGYMPTVEQHKLGGYESWLGTNRVEHEAAPKMVTRLLELLQEMR